MCVIWGVFWHSLHIVDKMQLSIPPASMFLIWVGGVLNEHARIYEKPLGCLDPGSKEWTNDHDHDHIHSRCQFLLSPGV